MLSRRGLAVAGGGAVLAVAGITFGVEEFVLLGAGAGVALVVGAGLLARQLWVGRRGLEARLGPLDVEIGVGDVVTTALSLANAGRRALTVLGAQEIEWRLSHPGLQRHPRSVSSSADGRHGPRWRPVGAIRSPAAVLAPGERVEISVPVPTDARGVRSPESVAVWCCDPLRLVCWPVRLAVAARVLVLPRPASAFVDAHGLGAPRPETEAGAPLLPLPEGADEFAGLRSYVPGDRLSRLDWPASTRSGALLVRQFVEARPRTSVIVVDTRPWKIEDSVAEAAAVGLAELARGKVVTLRTSAGEELELAPGSHGRLGLLRALAAVAPEPASQSAVLRALTEDGLGSRP